METTSEAFKISLQKLKSLCSLREYCSSEIEAKIRPWNLSPEEKQAMIHILKEDGFMDDLRYAKAFTHDKLQFNQWGPVKISFSLRSKGIGEETILLAIHQIEKKLWMEVLQNILEKKKKTTSANSNYEMKAKLFRYASGKGFDFDHIEKAMQKGGL